MKNINFDYGMSFEISASTLTKGVPGWVGENIGRFSKPDRPD